LVFQFTGDVYFLLGLVPVEMTTYHRDLNRCAKTIKAVFAKAKYPKRVHIGNSISFGLLRINFQFFEGLVQQIHTEEDAEGGCLHHYCALSGMANIVYFAVTTL
jgi:hypothetical protein